jgi:Cu(I)/Ag(I) efflux system protein CusF
MKRLITLAAVLALSIAMIPLSRAQGMGGMDMKGMDKDKKSAGEKSDGKTHKGAGTVKKVDSAGGKVTIAHGPIKSMNWPAMNMTFTVKDKMLLDKVSQDKKIEFEFVQQGSDYVITSVK